MRRSIPALLLVVALATAWQAATTTPRLRRNLPTNPGSR